MKGEDKRQSKQYPGKTVPCHFFYMDFLFAKYILTSSLKWGCALCTSGFQRVRKW